jgi:isoleucyl-tRNA synthetase
MANVDGLEKIVEPSEYGELDRWILSRAKEVFASVNSSFQEYDFLRGFAILNNFVTNELSGIYMDITKDRLYCDAKHSASRESTQSAMVLMSKAMMALVAPVLTYTIDEVLDYAPPIVKGDMESVFDLVYEELPDVGVVFEDKLLIEARAKFSESIDKLKKEKLIKSTLELEIVGDTSSFEIKDSKNLEDWFIVSALRSESSSEEVGAFELDGMKFTVHKAQKAKCPRCWRFTSDSEEEACERCAEVVGTLEA